MELRQLEYFVAVAQAGSFVRAAERLYVGQPAVSQQLSRLERELGVRLFDRTTRHVRLTPAGERLLPDAQATLTAVGRLRRSAADLAGSGDLLRIGTSHGLGERFYRALEKLAETAPDLSVKLTRTSRKDRLAAVRSGELDAAFVRVMRSAPGLTLVPVWQEQLVVALPDRHRLAHHETLRVEQLGELPLRLAPRESNPEFHDLIRTALQEAGVDPPAGPAFTTLQDTLAEIGVGPATWTVFNAGSEHPAVPTVALRPLAGLSATTSLATRPGPPAPSVQLLLSACTKVADQRG